MKLLVTVASFTLTVFLLPGLATADVRPVCDACNENCGLFDPSCWWERIKCRSMARGMRVVTTFVSTVCSFDRMKRRGEGRDMIEQAKDLLVDRKIFDRDFVDSNDIFFCSRLSNILSPSSGFAVAGYTPKPDLIWIDGSMMENSPEQFACLLAHELYHSQQTRAMGAMAVLCEYAMILLEGGGSSSSSENWMELDTYAFVASMRNCIVNNIDCPSESPSPSPSTSP
jgi:hypothetical protein